MNRNCVKGYSAPRQARVLVAKDHLISSAQADQLRQALGLNAVDKCKVNEVIERRVLIDTTAIWAPQALAQIKVPNFRGGFCIQINLVLTRTRIVTLLSPWHLKDAALSV